jgi:hypothetical protein
MYDGHRNHFGRTLWYSYEMRPRWMLVSVCLEIVLILMQDRFTICAESTIGSKIVLDTPDRTPR